MSIEVSPYLAHDPEQTLVEVRRLWHAIDRLNLTVKIPSTPASLPDIRRALSAGVNSNISVMFSLQNSRQEYDKAHHT